MESNQLELLLPPQPGAVPADQGVVGEQNGAADIGSAPLGAEDAAAQLGAAVPVPAAAAAGEATGAAGEQQQADAAAPAEQADAPKQRKHKWGPPAAGDWDDEQRKKKRRSRWETSTELIVPTAKAGAIIIPGQIPKEITICGGIKASASRQHAQQGADHMRVRSQAAEQAQPSCMQDEKQQRTQPSCNTCIMV